MIQFDEFLLNERLGISLDLKKISDFIFHIVKNLNKNKYVIDGKDIETEKIIIDKIYIKKINIPDSHALFNVNKTKMTEKGISIHINFDNSNEISESVVYHEVQHALDFYFKGKEKIRKQLFDIKSVNLSLHHFSNKNFKLFIQALYFSNQSEMNSFISESYSILSKMMKNISDEQEIKRIYLREYKNLETYEIITFLKSYDVYQLKKTDFNDLLTFFNIIDENYNHLLKHIKYTFTDKLNLILYSLEDLFPRYRFKKLRRKYKKIEEIETLLKKYDKRFKTAGNVMEKKLHNLLPLLIEEKTT